MSDTAFSAPGHAGVLATQAHQLMAVWLDAAAGPLALLDLSFPSLALGGFLRSDLPGLADAGAIPAAATAFYGRFRAAGGHRPLFGLGGVEDAAMLAAAELAWNQPGRQRLVYTQDPVAPAILETLHQAGAWMLVRGAAAVAVARLPALSVLPLVIETDGEAARYTLLLPAEAAPQMRRRLTEAGWGFGHVTPGKDAAEDSSGPVVLCAAPLPLPHDAPLLTQIPASALIHDGAYRSEADGAYSWVWTGPERHVRMVFGTLPPAARWLKVAVIGAGKAAQLEGLVATLDGATLPHRLERWSETSAGVIVDLPPGYSGSPILGLAVPATVQEPEGIRRLGLCIHKIEVFV
ncbi:hypothetical protein [Teichococcus aestuarii]|uniref:Uncharacterized protein n=1 Tax=Teichococcus aestuarii TaxID=568898 RepID=A0A2U1UXN4_9PROT|nr:hypothetical protein [Pseudoroseomonas aestuarii]PWC26331.1 hypothetical protein CR165_23790 [Pseudoroseomonas aestuarii]